MGDAGKFLFGSPGEPGQAYEPETYEGPYLRKAERLAKRGVYDTMRKPSYFGEDYESTQYDLLRQAIGEGMKERERSMAEVMNRGGVYAQGPHAQNLQEMLMKGQEQYGRRAGEIAVATSAQRAQEDMLRKQLALQWAAGQRPYAVTQGFGLEGVSPSTGFIEQIKPDISIF